MPPTAKNKSRKTRSVATRHRLLAGCSHQTTTPTAGTHTVRQCVAKHVSTHSSLHVEFFSIFSHKSHRPLERCAVNKNSALIKTENMTIKDKAALSNETPRDDNAFFYSMTLDSHPLPNIVTIMNVFFFSRKIKACIRKRF